ncbi:hypothetical protein GCM10010149_88630 [Nonomuraea roseoviolacea subsp. roseoviolacea]|uniref:hypothetical protein n=1 Tax=Nonomuraea roseoviolacea TaxID=103837 RepID=UPI0031DE9138
MKLFYLGAEIPGWRKLLAQEEVSHVGISFLGLSRRVKFARPWLIESKFPEDQTVMLESGATTINASPEKYQRADIDDLFDTYRSFVAANIARVELVSELDAVHLGQDWIGRQREELAELAGDKLLPIWHADTGLAELERLADVYGRVGVPQASVNGRDITSVLNRLAKSGTKLHGVAMTKVEVMQEIAWDSVASTSWLSPAKFGDSQIWTGRELKRYPKKYKEQGRRRHRHVLEAAGFDTDAYEADDTQEVLRVAIWSWQQFVEHINTRKAKVPSMSADEPLDENSEFGDLEVGSELQETRTEHLTLEPRERSVLPGLELTEVTRIELGEDGENRHVTEAFLGVKSGSLRQCNTCSIGSPEKCRGYRADAECIYDIPATIKTTDQYIAAKDALVSIQWQRVAFGRRVEEAEGGYPDPNLTKEVQVLDKMLNDRIEQQTESETLTITAKRRGVAQSGFVAQIFGEKASEAARALPAAVPSDQLFEDAGIVEAEVVEG